MGDYKVGTCKLSPNLNFLDGREGLRLIPMPVANILINPAYVTKSL